VWTSKIESNNSLAASVDGDTIKKNSIDFVLLLVMQRTPPLNISLTICISFKFINKEDELNYFIVVNPPVFKENKF